MTVAVVQFPGSNCDRDVMYVLQSVLKTSVSMLWHGEVDLPVDVHAVVLPGGFSFGDYLRAGAIAAHSSIMQAVKRFADRGGPVLGICNGFQILCEAGLLPGCLLPNHHNRFVCSMVDVDVHDTSSPFLTGYQLNQRIKLPVAHHDGRYVADDATYARLLNEHRIPLRYAQRDENGDAVLNGSRGGAAGVLGGIHNNVLGLMPHPERSAEKRLGNNMGYPLLAAFVQSQWLRQ